MKQDFVNKKSSVNTKVKKHKKIYEINLMALIVLILVPCSIVVYAINDKQPKENENQDDVTIALNNDNALNNETTNDVLTADDASNESTEQEAQQNQDLGTYVASDGSTYHTIGSINIPKLGIEYPILSDTSPSLLKISVCKFWGSNPNEEGNLCIAGHNYRNAKFFSKVSSLEDGDIIEITDLEQRTEQYSVYDKYTVLPNDNKCTTQLTNGKTIVTLITCTNDNKQRYIVQAEKI